MTYRGQVPLGSDPESEHLLLRLLHNTSAAFAGQVRFVVAFFAAFFQFYTIEQTRRKNMFEECGIDFLPETHEDFSDREWKLAREFFNLMLHLPLPEDEYE